MLMAPMTVLAETPRTAAFDANRDANLALVAELRERLALVQRGGGDEAVARHTGRGKLLARERIDRLVDPGSPFLELSPLAAWDMYDGEAPVGRDRDRHRGRRRPRGRDRRQRRDRQGRHVLPDDGQEAPAPAGDRRREPPAVRLPRRLGRGVPAAAGRRVPGSRALRPDLLQPGQPVGRRDRADRRRHGLVHRGRRLRAGDERRDGDRQGDRHDLHRRPAAGEGGDRRGGLGRGPRRRGRPHPRVGRRRPLRRRRRARPRDRAPHPGQRAGRGARTRRGTCSRRASRCYDPAELYGIVPTDLRQAFDVRDVIARIVDGSELDEFKARYGTTLVTGFARIHGLPGRASSPTTASCSARARSRAPTSSSCAPSGGSRSCSSRTSPGSWSAASTRTGASPATARRW